jgi:excisionase family DNA binding protein
MKSIPNTLTRLERKVVTISEAAIMLALTPLTIRRAIKSGKLKAMQMQSNGRYRIPIEEIDAFIQRNSTQAR